MEIDTATPVKIIPSNPNVATNLSYRAPPTNPNRTAPAKSSGDVFTSVCAKMEVPELGISTCSFRCRLPRWRDLYTASARVTPDFFSSARHHAPTSSWSEGHGRSHRYDAPPAFFCQSCSRTQHSGIVSGVWIFKPMLDGSFEAESST